MDNEQANLELNFLTPTVASDGNSIFISNEGNVPTLTFFQVRRQIGNVVHADAVASIRFSSVDDLRGLQRSIEETITNHENREK